MLGLTFASTGSLYWLPGRSGLRRQPGCQIEYACQYTSFPSQLLLGSLGLLFKHALQTETVQLDATIRMSTVLSDSTPSL